MEPPAGAGAGREGASLGDASLTSNMAVAAVGPALVVQGVGVPHSSGSVYPEVLEAVGLRFEQAEERSDEKAAMAAVRLPLKQLEVITGGDATGGGRSEGGKPPLPFQPLPRERGGGGVTAAAATAGVRSGGHLPSALPARLLADEDLVLPTPVRLGGPTGDEQASNVTDALRAHRGHELLRHSPLGQREPGGAGGSRPWGDVDEQRGAEARAQRIESGSGGVSAGDSDVKSGGAGGGRGQAGVGGVGEALGEVAGQPRDSGDGGDVWAGVGGEVRLQGVGTLLNGGSSSEESAAVSQARALLAQGLISEEELEAVAEKDQVRPSGPGFFR